MIWLALCIGAAELMGRLGDWAHKAANEKYAVSISFRPPPTRCCCAEVEAAVITREQLEQLERTILGN